MRRERCLIAALCLLVSLMAVAMATEGKTEPVSLGVAMATEDKTGRGPLPSSENYQRQNSPKLGPEYEQRTTGSNFSVTAAEKSYLHVLLSSSDQEKLVLDPSVSVSKDGKGQMPPAAPSEKKPSSIASSPYDPDEDQGTGRLLVAVARTLVTTTASTTTITVLSTCHNAAPLTPLPTVPCTGRRKRKLGSSSLANSEGGLDSSMASGSVLVNKRNVRAGRFILWSSSVTTVTIRTTSTNALITVMAVFNCLAPGLVACG